MVDIWLRPNVLLIQRQMLESGNKIAIMSTSRVPQGGTGQFCAKVCTCGGKFQASHEAQVHELTRLTGPVGCQPSFT